MRALSLAALALALASPATAQVPAPATPAPMVLREGTLLTVTAEARAESAPDLAVMTAGVNTNAATATEAMRLNAQRMQSVIAALQRAEVAKRDIQTSGLTLQPQYDYREQQPPRLVGYQALNQVEVRLRELDRIGPVLDALVAAGANQVSGPDFQLDDPDRALDAARIEAVKKARARADLYAQSLGMRVARVLQLSEALITQPPPYPMPVMRQAAMEAADASTPVAPGQVRLTTNITMLFELQ